MESDGEVAESAYALETSAIAQAVRGAQGNQANGLDSRLARQISSNVEFGPLQEGLDEDVDPVEEEGAHGSHESIAGAADGDDGAPSDDEGGSANGGSGAGQGEGGESDGIGSSRPAGRSSTIVGALADVQLWDCTEHDEPKFQSQKQENAGVDAVQAKCSQCEAKQEEESKPIQAKCSSCDEEEEHGQVGEAVQLWDCTEYEKPECKMQMKESPGGSPVQAKCSACEDDEQIQQKTSRPRRSQVIRRAAKRGLRDANTKLPHFEIIQAGFGRHDISGIQTRIGGVAAEACREMGALAFTSGERIAFRTAPDLRLAAHEAAHTIQQRAGLQLPGNVGRVGDKWERHADQVAEAVVGGRSAEGLLDQVAGATKSSVPSEAAPVQQRITSGATRIVEPGIEDEQEHEEEDKQSNKGPAGTRPANKVSSKSRAEGNDAAVAAEMQNETGRSANSGVETVDKTGSSTTEGASAGAHEGGAPRGATCYVEGSKQPPDDTPEPTKDQPSTKPKDKTKVKFDQWEEPDDTCGGKAIIEKGEGKMPEGIGLGTESRESVKVAAKLAVATRKTVKKAEEVAEEDSANSGEGSEQEAQEDPWSTAEAGRDTAIDMYDESTGRLAGVRERAFSLRDGVEFGDGTTGDLVARQLSTSRVQSFMDRAAEQISAAVAFATQQLPGQIGEFAESTKSGIAEGIAAEKAAISERANGAREHAADEAARSKSEILAEYQRGVELVEAETAATIAALEAHYEKSRDDVDTKEEGALQDINSTFSVGRRDHEKKGVDFAKMSVKRGQEFVEIYDNCKTPKDKSKYDDDGFWDGCLTVRRAHAQQKAACTTAEGFRDGMLRTANEKAFNLGKLRAEYRCTVIAAAGQVHKSLDDVHARLVSGVKSGAEQSIAQLGAIRDQNTAAITENLALTMTEIADRELQQRQSVNDAGYLHQVSVENLAHRGAANLVKGIAVALESLEATLTTLNQRFGESEAIPDPIELSATLANAEQSLGGGMGSLLGKMQEGSERVQSHIAEIGGSSQEALAEVTQGHDEASAASETSFAEQMGTLSAGARTTMREVAQRHVDKAKDSAQQGIESMNAAVTGYQTAVEGIKKKAKEALGDSLSQLEAELKSEYNKLDNKIVVEAWRAAKKEQPAWKGVVAVVLIIAVVIAAVAISIVTLGAGAGLFAMILVGALVGAASAGLIQAISNWSEGEDLLKGVGRAMVIGAVGGAIGGGLGGLAGAASGASALAGRYVAQFAINMTADLVAEGLTQTFSYVAFGQEFNWQGFVTAVVMSGISFRGSGARPSGGDGVGAPAPRMDAPSPAGTQGAHAAAMQIGTGFAAGVATEYAIAKASGQEFDLAKSLSTAASAAASVRASRRTPGAPSGDSSTPRGRFKRGLDKVRNFDPGGVGQKLNQRVEGLVNRKFGGDVSSPVQGGSARTGTVEDHSSTPVRATEAEAEIWINGEHHALSVVPRSNGRKQIILCSNQCGEFILKVRRMQQSLDPSSEAWKALDELGTKALKADEQVNALKPMKEPQPGEDVNQLKKAHEEAEASANEALKELRTEMKAIHKRYGVIDPNVPVDGVGTAAQRATDAQGSRVDISSHLPEGVEMVGSQHQINLSRNEISIPAELKNLGGDVEYVYVLRDVDSGEILKVGETEDIHTRGEKYALAAESYAMGRSVALEVQAVKVSTEQFKTAASIEGPLRKSVEKAISVQDPQSGRPKGTDILPWDGTNSRLVDAGPATPGVRDRKMRQKGIVWYGEKKFGTQGNVTPERPKVQRKLPSWAVVDNSPTDVAKAYARFGELLRKHNGNLSAAAREMGTTPQLFHSYMKNHGLTVDMLKALPPPESMFTSMGKKDDYRARQAEINKWNVDADSYTDSGAPVYHGTTNTRIGIDERSIRVQKNLKPEEGIHDLVVHGARYDERGSMAHIDDELPLNTHQVADAIRGNPNYKGEPIRMVVCHGAHGGCTSMAADLSRDLGVEVIAASDVVLVPRAENSLPHAGNSGTWTKFSTDGTLTPDDRWPTYDSE